MSALRTTSAFGGALLLAAVHVGDAGCKGGDGGSSKTADAGLDAASGLPRCPDDAPAVVAPQARDEFGPNAVAQKPATTLARMNVYEATSARTLERVDIYLVSELAGTRLTVAVHEASAKDKPFTKLVDVAVQPMPCEGWLSTGPISVPLVAGRYYLIGFDPNQPVTGFIVADTNNLPTDGSFGRLVGSKTGTSVSLPQIGWDKFTDKEHQRQRLTTSPRAADPMDAGGG